MTNFDIERLGFDRDQIGAWESLDPRYRNWPVVYVLTGSDEVYVGETINAAGRMHQHLASTSKKDISFIRVVLDDTFNKSVCLDLESRLIDWFFADARWAVLNQNAGIVDADYYQRDTYRKTFEEIFEALRTEEGLFDRTLPELINSDLFKFSPFKALNTDQAAVVNNILEGLFNDIQADLATMSVIEGGPGTGKTIVAIYLLKLLADIQTGQNEDIIDSDSIFSEFFTAGHPELLQGLRIGFVVPQQSLRESVSKVFRRIPGLSPRQVLTPFEVGGSEQRYDILIVDEAHRLNQRANQPSAVMNRRFAEINERLFGDDDPGYTQLDWIRKQSTHVIMMIDAAQTVRPADLAEQTVRELVAKAETERRRYRLWTQMRIRSDQDYVGYVRAVLSDTPPEGRVDFDGYDLAFFDDLGEMRRMIVERNAEVGLCRMVAGYAWEWRSKTDRSAYDIEIDGQHLRWNSTQRDWINSVHSINEVGSIHTVQGYDLNIAGVIVGGDLCFDEKIGRIVFDRERYFDKKGRENNPRRGITYSDDDLLRYVRNIYAVLLTRGILGTYLYVSDPPLREYLRKYFSPPARV